MLSLDEIKEYVVANGFGREMRELPDWYWSKGIIYAYENDKELWKPYLKKALEQAGTDNYGGFYEYDEEPIPGREYYICESPYGNDIDNGIIVHKENGCIITYFQFER